MGWRALPSTAVTMAPNPTVYLVLISPVLAPQLTYPPPPKTFVWLLEPPPPLPSPRPYLRPECPTDHQLWPGTRVDGTNTGSSDPGSREPSAQVESPVGGLQGGSRAIPGPLHSDRIWFCEADWGWGCPWGLQ